MWVLAFKDIKIKVC